MAVVTIPELSLVVLVGPSGSGKSTFARRHFKPTEVLSSDYCRGLVSDDENDLAATGDAFDVLHYVAGKRLAAGKLTVVDATSVKPEDRKPLVQLAREYHCLPVAIVFDIGARICADRNALRQDRNNMRSEVIRNQQGAMRRGLRFLRKEGFRHVFVFNTPEEADAAIVERTPLWNNKQHEHGPFDIIGDVHGCFDELVALLGELGWEWSFDFDAPETLADPLVTGHYLCGPRLRDNATFRPVGEYATGQAEPGPGQLAPALRHPAGRKAVLLGDLVDRGPKTPQVLKLVMPMVWSGAALCVPGNHDMKLMRKLRGQDVQITHGLAESLAQLDAESAEFRKQVAEFLDGLVSHYVFDDGSLVVAHAGMKAEMQGRGSGKVRDFALYGETTGETDEFGLPIRYNWAAEYRGRAMVVYGHTPVPEPEWLNRTINIDTGCVFGGRLTALRYPERELVSAPAKRVYAESKKPFAPAGASDTAAALSAQQAYDDVLDIADMLGKRIVSTRLQGSVIISEEQGAAALEVMSRFAANPKWLIYLPPTMSPCETAQDVDLLEHPREAFAHYRNHGQPRVVCEEKHMGSRAVVVLCRNEGVARRRFGVVDDGRGIVYTRTGRRFFENREQEAELLDRLSAALGASGFWEELKTDWATLDCELMPWSAKAKALLQDQYAAVGAAARSSLAEATAAIQHAADNGREVRTLLDQVQQRAALIEQYVRAYQQYCWSVESVADLKLAPFHVLATEGQVHVDRDHVWHMDTLAKACAADPGVLLATPYKIVDLTDDASQREGIAWWTELTARGGEGMVVKPYDFIARGRRGMVQPAIKCRGREYLRIIYGPEYTLPEHIERLRTRSLNRKRALALREFALGIEALERFVRGEPLRRTHECVFGVLALESEPVDPRL
ncbi:MAG: polynucleotide kinase-phosphatase [Phycisphaerae bacterium]|jgi:protein phosphatase